MPSHRYLFEANYAGRQLRILSSIRRIDRPSLKRAIRWQVARFIGYPTALIYRLTFLRRVTFIGVTGSTGKTTTKELIHSVLSQQMVGRKNDGNNNIAIHETTLQIRPWHRYCVQEVAAAIGGLRIRLEKPLRLVRPKIAVVTNIGRDHLAAFGSVEDIAAEKGKLVAAVPETGVAFLNADDPQVIAMRSRCRGRIVTYGLSRDAMIRAENVSCSWPERLSFELVYLGQRHAVRTQLCGTIWVPCVLATIGVALEMDIPLATVLRTLETTPPVDKRMQPVSRPDGVSFIRDDLKTPPASIAPALQFLADASAPRKIVIFGTLSDYAGSSRTAYKQAAMQALDVADLVVFVGPQAPKSSGARRHPKGGALHAFVTMEAAAPFLAETFQQGDVVLLKGSDRSDNLGCIISIAAAPSGASPIASTAAQKAHVAPATSSDAVPLSWAIIGLGNPEERYKDTPHSVGHRALDRLAEMLHAEWKEAPRALIAETEWKGTKLRLIKTMSPINFSGTVVQELSHSLGFGPSECVLVQDDIDLPLGAARTRMKGSDGGHKGVRSILEVFRTDAVARVKIGIGRPENRSKAAEHVLRHFSPDELTTIEDGCAAAIEKLLKMVATPPRPTENKKITA